MRLLVVSLVLASALASCAPSSLGPVYEPDKSDVVFDKAYLGTWTNDDKWMIVASNGDGGFVVTIPTDEEDDPLKVEAYLVSVRAADGTEHRIVDCLPAAAERKRLSERYAGMVVPAHVAFPVRWGEQNSQLVLLIGSPRFLTPPPDERQALEAVQARFDALPQAAAADGKSVLAASPGELREFYAATAGDDRVWEFGGWRRVEPEAAPKDGGR